jgi:hypothetical protein
MSLMTPNGIQVRFDHDRIDPCVQPLKDGGHIGKILADLDLWESMPNALGNVMAIGAAVITKSALLIVFYGFVGYILGTLIKAGRYSRTLKRLLPQILGSPIISIIFAVCVGLFLLQYQAIVSIIVLFLVVTNNGLGTMNIFEVLTAPVRRVIHDLHAKRPDFPYTHTERVFMAICERKTKDLGIVLRWDNGSPVE